MGIRLSADIISDVNVRDVIDDYLRPDVKDRLGELGLRELKTGASLWPVDTGFSKRNFYVLIEGERVGFYNEADYAKYVEAGIPARRTEGSAWDTLRRALPEMVKTIAQDWRRGHGRR